MAGLWQQREVSDGTYDFADLVDAHEYLNNLEENRERLADQRHQG
jgi:hypothetical protein